MALPPRALRPSLAPTLTRALTRPHRKPASAGSLSSLFALGEQGAWYDPSDLTTLFQDSAGTTPVTAAGQPVGLMLDKSGRGNHAAQSTAGFRPTYQTSGGLHWLASAADGKQHLIFNVAAYGTAPPLSMMGAMSLTAPGFFPIFLGSDSLSDGVFFGLGDNADQKMRAALGGGTGGTTTIRGLAAFTTNQSYVVSHIVDPTAFSCWIDGVKQSEVARSGTWGLPTQGHVCNGGSIIVTFMKFFGTVILRRAMSLPEANSVGAYYAAKSGSAAYNAGTVTKKAYAVGDSTVAAYSGQPSISSLVSTVHTRVDVAVPGHTIAQQKTAWNALTVDPATVGWVVMQIGLNDLNPASGTTASKIAELQDLANTIKASIGSAPLFVSKMLPCKQRLINIYGAVDGLVSQQRWVDMNQALAGLGGSPITGVTARITGHVPLLDDGAGNLAAAYDTGDGIHPNTPGRQIMADAWSAAIPAAGVTL